MWIIETGALFVPSLLSSFDWRVTHYVVTDGCLSFQEPHLYIYRPQRQIWSCFYLQEGIKWALLNRRRLFPSEYYKEKVGLKSVPGFTLTTREMQYCLVSRHPTEIDRVGEANYSFVCLVDYCQALIIFAYVIKVEHCYSQSCIILFVAY
jgi:hypothetical protein